MGWAFLLADMDRAGGHVVILGVLLLVGAVGGVSYALMQARKNRAARARNTMKAPESRSAPSDPPRSTHD
jgi:hypothetical protein